MQDYDELFQERIDELLLIEQRAERRAEQFLELNKAHQEKNYKTYDQLFSKVSEVNQSLKKINEASEKVSYYVDICRKQATRSTTVLLYAIMAATFIIGGTIWWSHHINSNLADARTELEHLNTKLAHTPMIIHYEGKDFIRVTPGSESTFNRGDKEMPGKYAEVKYAK